MLFFKVNEVGFWWGSQSRAHRQFEQVIKSS